MTTTKICFYNHWHYGDVFASKGYVQQIIKQLPGAFVQYATSCHPDAIRDMDLSPIDISRVPISLLDQHQVEIVDNILYVNTWIGAYDVLVFGQAHGNWPTFERMWKIIYDKISSAINYPLVSPKHIFESLAETNWKFYDTHSALTWLEKYKNNRLFLFCNGNVRSEQTSLGDMSLGIQRLAALYPSDVFLCTQNFDTNLTNIHFSSNIFNKSNDINEISFLSTFATLIWGKNSGPFMYCHVRENVMNPQTTFFACSDRPSDSYAYNTNIICRYYHSMSSNEDRVIDQLQQAINHMDTGINAGRMTVLE